MLNSFQTLTPGSVAPSLYSDCDKPSGLGFNFMCNKLVGQTFGRLTVLSKHGKNANGNVTWVCLCVCGNNKIANGSSLKRGILTSCGCLLKEIARGRLVTHGMSKTPEYLAWTNMRRRCYNEADISYQNYGGRGIIVCDRWLGEDGFINFFADMGKRPSKIHSIDRFPNNDTGNYDPNNCRWATQSQQLRNFRKNLWYEYSGEKMVVTDWETKWGIPKNSIQTYLKRGKTFEWIYKCFENRKANSFYHNSKAFEYAKRNSENCDLYIYKYANLTHVSKTILRGQSLIAHFYNGKKQFNL